MPQLWPKAYRRILPQWLGQWVLGLGIIMTMVLPMACNNEESSSSAEKASAPPTEELSSPSSTGATASPSPLAEAKESPGPIGSETPLDKEIRAAIDSGKVVLVFFYSGCAPCKYRSQLTVFDALEKEYAERLAILRIAEAEPAAEFGVTTFPTLLLLTPTAEGNYSIFWRLEGTTDRPTLENVLTKAFGMPAESGTPSTNSQTQRKEQME